MLVALSSGTYFLISHFIFPKFVFLKSNIITTTLLDSLVTTIIAFFAIRKIYRLLEDKRFERERANEAEYAALVYARRLIEASLDPLVTISSDGRVDDVNAATELVTGYSRNELIGTDFSHYFTDQHRARNVYEQVLQRGSIRDFELTLRHRNGHLTPVLYNASVYLDKEKKVKGVFAAARDMTHYQAALKEIERKNSELVALNTIARTVSQSLEMRELLDNTLNELIKLPFFRGEVGGMIFLPDERSSDLSVMVSKGIPENHPCLKLPVRPGECLCGLAFSSEDLIISHEKAKDARQTRRCHWSDQRGDVCIPLKARNSIVGVLYLMLPEAFVELIDRDANFFVSIGGQIGIAVDNARLYEAVKEQHEQLRQLTYRLGEVEVSERRELARELHDQVGQNLTALGISLNILKAQLSQDAPEHVQSRIDDCFNLVSETTARIRDVMAELRPSVLDDYGLLSALEWYSAQFSLRTGIEVRVDGDEDGEYIDISVENALFRIAQEALTNVAKHAEASRVTIVLDAKRDRVRMTIVDNGKGFETNRPLPHNETGSWGFRVMSERAMRAGGTFQAESEPGRGTKIIVEVVR